MIDECCTRPDHGILQGSGWHVDPVRDSRPPEVPGGLGAWCAM